MDINLSSDHPIRTEIEDKFQRYSFSKRIAETIAERKSNNCIVIGIYGAWGEGKTSVLNFIEGELKHKEEVIPVKFNPWRYHDENTLLAEFFNNLAAVLDKDLKSNKEKIGDLLNKYSKLVNIPVLGDFSGVAETAGKALGETDIETLKKRISAIINESGKKLVVFIDDIDRLDKTEIHAIFRLVKLTADFSKTTYLLSFDEEMVSAAIGDRFGQGDKNAGQQFLEKIVQVPLRIPMAQPSALHEFTIGLLNNVLDPYGINIVEGEANRFLESFQKAILTKLDTPRLAIRYSNTLSFSLPLLIGEINVVDLMLIEAVKIFYPEHYEFIKTNSDYFIGSYIDSYSSSTNTSKVERITNHLAILGKKLNESQVTGIKDLLINLFPRLREAFKNTGHHGVIENQWYKNRRIVSPEYFNRYFSYTVIKGDVSDVSLENLITTFSSQNPQEQEASVRLMIERSLPENFVRKLRSKEEDYSWEVAVPLARALTKCSDLFTKPGYDGFFISMGPYAQSAIFISRLVELHKDQIAVFELVKELISEIATIDYAFELIRWVRAVNKEENIIFKAEKIDDLSYLILIRSLRESADKPLYIQFPEHTYKLFGIWHEKEPKKFRKYITDLFKKYSDAYIKILYALTSKIHSSSIPEPYYTNIDKAQYDYITHLIDENLLKEQIFKNFPEDELSGPIIWEKHEGPYQTDINLVRQFLHWYNEKLKPAK